MDNVLLHLKTYVIDLINAIRIADFFDITVIAVLTYLILIWFKKATSRFVLIGIIMLGLIYTVSRVLDMYLTQYVLQGFFAILLIALIVIFQEDTRRFFERLAMWRFIRKGSPSITSIHDVDIIAHAVRGLAQKKYGALIVLKGDDYIDRHLEGGIELNGILSEALLESIFDPHSIGHDGAVVIEKGRVTKFGCHLPLSTSSKKIGALGLRHTAALGLSELTDALCIVVSEENGTISIARNENLRKLTSVEQLQKILENFFQARFPKAIPKGWLRWIRENTTEKGIAVLLACILWLAFAYQTESIRKDFTVPIEYRNLPSYWVIEEPKASEASVTLTGSPQAFNLLNPQTLNVILDVSELKEGSQSFLLSRDLIRHPSNLSVAGIQPDKIRLTAHKMIPIDIPIKIETTGKCPPGCVIKIIEANPQSVKVMALNKEKKELKISTEPINLNSITTLVTVLKPKLVFPPNIQFVNGKPPEVLVRIQVEEKPVTNQKTAE